MSEADLPVTDLSAISDYVADLQHEAREAHEAALHAVILGAIIYALIWLWQRGRPAPTAVPLAAPAG